MAKKKTTKKKAAKTKTARRKSSSSRSAGRTSKGVSKKSTGNTKAKAKRPARRSTKAKAAAAQGKRKATGKGSNNTPSTAAASAKKADRRTAGKRPAASRTTPANAAKPRPLPKTRLADKQLKMFREMLLAKRRELTGDVRNLTNDALGRSRQDSTGDLSAVPIHMADLGSDNWEQDFTIGLIANEQQLVREIDEALRRIDDRTYGICVATGKPITIARLKAKPWAKYCIEYARQRELGRV